MGSFCISTSPPPTPQKREGLGAQLSTKAAGLSLWVTRHRPNPALGLALLLSRSILNGADNQHPKEGTHSSANQEPPEITPYLQPDAKLSQP